MGGKVAAGSSPKDSHRFVGVVVPGLCGGSAWEGKSRPDPLPVTRSHPESGMRGFFGVFSGRRFLLHFRAFAKKEFE